MADYWKSQPKKFCDYCKCWIADNRPSIEFHERGKNHKENVAKRISEIKQKSLEKAKEEEKASKEFAAMEAAALKAYQEDLKRLGISSDDTESSSPQVTSTVPRVSLSNQKEKKKRKKDLSNIDSVGASKWAEGVSSEGYKYYYNTITGESQWEKPEGFQGKFSKKAALPLWVEGLSEEGYTYYYNTETGESKWEKPEDFVPQVGDPLSSNSTETPAAPAESKSSDSDSDSSEIQETEEEEKSETSTEAQKPKIKFRKKTKNDHAEETETKSKEEKSDGNQEQDSSSGSLEEKPKSPKKPDPYGEWKEIKQEDDPYEKIDLELPSTEDEYVGGPVADTSDPKVTFKEKTVTSLGDVAEGVAPVFKKRRFDNGKSRNLRQRGGDQ